MENSSNLAEISETAAVVWAAHYQFAPGESLEQFAVGSRRISWAVSGRGAILVSGRAFAVSAGTALVLPWNHDVQFAADREDPFLVAGVHVVPWHATGSDVRVRPALGANDRLIDPAIRRDRGWPGFADVTVLTGTAAHRIMRLGEALVDHFAGPLRDSASMRAAGVLLVRALLSTDPSEQHREPLPATLTRIQGYALSHLSDSLSSPDLARAGGCSPATMQRLFLRFTGRRPQQWVRATRLEEARSLLLTSGLRIGEIATRIGFDDPLYFSRVFRERFGVPPSQVERGGGLV